jgi:hypothetical protein
MRDVGRKASPAYTGEYFAICWRNRASRNTVPLNAAVTTRATGLEVRTERLRRNSSGMRGDLTLDSIARKPQKMRADSPMGPKAWIETIVAVWAIVSP